MGGEALPQSHHVLTTHTVKGKALPRQSSHNPVQEYTQYDAPYMEYFYTRGSQRNEKTQ